MSIHKKRSESSPQKGLGFEALEKMLDDFDLLYDDQKSQLYTQLSNLQNFGERRLALDDFFWKLESESNKIQNSQVYRAFKNLYLSGGNLQKAREEHNHNSVKV